MAISFNANNFDKADGEKISALIEMAEIGGYDVFKVVSTNIKTSFKTNSTQTLKRPMVKGSNAPYGVEPVLVTAPTPMYKDASTGYCVGFIVDTPKNRKRVGQLMGLGILKPVSKSVEEEIMLLCNESGIKTTKKASVKAFDERGGRKSKSNNPALVKNARAMLSEIEEMKIEMAKLKAEKESAQAELTRIEAEKERAQVKEELEKARAERIANSPAKAFEAKAEKKAEEALAVDEEDSDVQEVIDGLKEVVEEKSEAVADKPAYTPYKRKKD